MFYPACLFPTALYPLLHFASQFHFLPPFFIVEAQARAVNCRQQPGDPGLFKKQPTTVASKTSLSNRIFLLLCGQRF